jgi:hypothetical protein
MRPRFSLRTLLVLTALVAAGCYWWIARPTAVAERFIAAIKNGQLDVLHNQMQRIGITSERDVVVNVEISARTWLDSLRGRRHGYVHLWFGSSGLSLSFWATPTGVYLEDVDD